MYSRNYSTISGGNIKSSPLTFTASLGTFMHSASSFLRQFRDWP